MHELSVLEDASGRRARWMRRAGRSVFVVFLAWLVVIVLGGLGVGPAGRVPFSGALRPSRGPPPVVRLPETRQPSPSDLRPALPASAVAQRPPARSRARPPVRAVAHGRATAPGQIRKRLSDSHGRATAPGQTGAVPGRAATAPGQTGAVPGRAATAPGHLKTKRGRSATAPGRTTTNPRRR